MQFQDATWFIGSTRKNGRTPLQLTGPYTKWHCLSGIQMVHIQLEMGWCGVGKIVTIYVFYKYFLLKQHIKHVELNL